MLKKIHFGTAGWNYNDWIGPFYPRFLGRSQQLKFYSDYFKFVEINSTFYNLPQINSVETWYEAVPDNFYFIVKVWSEITHKLGDNGLTERLDEFLYRLNPLKEKLSGFLFQFPPWFKFSESHETKLNNLINLLPIDIKSFIELRDNSWFNPKILSNLINGKNIVLATTYMPGISPFYLEHQQIYYIRLIGDRKLTKFNKIQRTQDKVIEDLFQNLKNLKKFPEIYEIFIIVNNHFAGFAPETINQLKRGLDLPIINFSPQKNLSDFL